MIRFCDGEVGCAEYDLLSRGQLISYFLAGHMDEIVSVYDSSSTYMGIITYNSLLYSISIDAAICREYVILDNDIWDNVREIFKTRSRNFRNLTLLPVLDKDMQLICFAYQDEDANREMRMLRELGETKGVLQFADVFPEYKCVKIHEFNELAFFFAEYLKDQRIVVQVDGVLWQDFFSNEECQVPEYECMHIYAEGTWEKTINWKENLLRSASVEFECIDKIYEKNIKNNLISNDEVGYEELLRYLHTEKEIIICGTGMWAQDTYDFLLGNGIEACCFMVDEQNDVYVHRMFGKKILGLSEVIYTYQNPVFIDGESKNSAWGFGQVDYYDYIGFKRNKNFFMLRDYVEITGNSLLNILSKWRVLLAGDVYLSKYLAAFLRSKNISVAGYLDVLTQDAEWDRMDSAMTNEGEDVVCLIVAPDFFASNDINVHKPYKFRDDLIRCLRKTNIDNYSDYFCHMIPFINMQECNINKYFNKNLTPKRIVIGSIEIVNGTTLLGGLLDGHPDILLMPNCYAFKDNLFWTSLRLSMVEARDILSAFWDISKEWDSMWCRDAEKFNEKMRELLASDDQFTSQEIFVMLYMAYMYMGGRDMEISQSIIYWDPHYLASEKREKCVIWLGEEQVHYDIVNVVRNACMSRGSHVKGFISLSWTGTGLDALKDAYTAGVYAFLDVEKEIYKWNDRLVIQFEELKRNPKETLLKICARWGIVWSDSLMQTTRYGKRLTYNNGEKNISDFDMTPVYNTYEKYFSEFDRLRVMLIQTLWQRSYGYPYLELKQFSRRELQEMFLKGFRFDELVELDGRGLDLDFRLMLQHRIRIQLQKIRMVEMLEYA